MQHGRRDDHLVEGLVVAPDGEVCGLSLLTAAEGYRGQREPGAWAVCLALAPRPLALLSAPGEFGDPLFGRASRAVSLGLAPTCARNVFAKRSQRG